MIEQAAEPIFAERGYAGTRLQDVAAAAGVTKPVLYLHFESKKALHMALLAKHREGLLSALAASAAVESPLPSRLPAILDAWFAYVEQHPYAWRLLFRDTTGDPQIQQFYRELQASARALTASLIAAEPEVSIPDTEVEPLAELIRSASSGLALWWLEHPDVPRELVVSVLTRVLREGARAWQTQHPR
ncbi:MAG: TetR/AcrR family transcriptional regulator [Solirubrobacteraceae bacterium]